MSNIDTSKRNTNLPFGRSNLQNLPRNKIQRQPFKKKTKKTAHSFLP